MAEAKFENGRGEEKMGHHHRSSGDKKFRCGATNFKPKKASQRWSKHNKNSNIRQRDEWIGGDISRGTHFRGEEAEEKGEAVFSTIQRESVSIGGYRITKVERTIHGSRQDMSGIDILLTLESSEKEVSIPVQIKSWWDTAEIESYRKRGIVFLGVCPSYGTESLIKTAKKILNEFLSTR